MFFQFTKHLFELESYMEASFRRRVLNERANVSVVGAVLKEKYTVFQAVYEQKTSVLFLHCTNSHRS